MAWLPFQKTWSLGSKNTLFKRCPSHRWTSHTNTDTHTHTVGNNKSPDKQTEDYFYFTPFLILLFAVRLSSENGPSSAEHSRALPKLPKQPVQLFRYLSNGPSMVVKKQKNLLIFFTQRISEFLKGWLFRLFFVEAVAVFGQIVSAWPNSWN